MTATDGLDRRGTLAATIAGSSLTFVVGSIVNVALPVIEDDLETNAAGAQWVVSAYLLPLGALVLLGGALGDHYGRKRVFLAGLAVFALACLACALAPNLPVLLVGRALEGVGAAMIAPTSLAIIADAFSGEARGRAVGTWAAAGAAAGALAPVLGGAIVDAAGWRWAFMAIVPVAAGTAWVAARSLRESRAPDALCAPLDWSGAGLASLGLLLVTWGLTALPGRGPDAATLGALAGGAATLAAFLWVERMKGERAMMPLSLFGDPTFAGLSILTFLLYAGLGGLFVLLPYLLIGEMGFGSLGAGLGLLPFPVILAVLSQTAGGPLAARLGTRTVLAVGSGLVAAGYLLMALMPAEGASYWRHVLPGLLVLAVGMGVVVAPLTSAVLGSAGEARSGVASGVNNAVARVAGLIATALLGLVLVGPDGSLAAGTSAAASVGVGLAVASGLSAWALIRDAPAAAERA